MKHTSVATAVLATAALLAATLAVSAPATAEDGPQHMLGSHRCSRGPARQLARARPRDGRRQLRRRRRGHLRVTHRIDELGVARSMARAGNDDRVWISTNASVVEVNLVTFSVTKTVDLPADCQGRSIAWGLGRVWVALPAGRAAGSDPWFRPTRLRPSRPQARPIWASTPQRPTCSPHLRGSSCT